MALKLLERAFIREKSIKRIDNYLSLSKNHRISVGFYYKGEKYILEEAYRDSDYQYDIGSISKTITAHFVLLLETEGLINTNDSVDKYLALPEGEYPTIYELLTHSAGYGNLTPREITVPRLLMHGYARKNLYTGCTVNTVIRALSRRRRKDKAGKYGYSDFAFAILACIVESVLKRPFSDAFEDFVKTRLGMRETKLMPDVNLRTPKSAYGKFTIPFWRWNERNPYVAAGGLVSTVGDMLEYSRLEIESREAFITKAHVKTDVFAKHHNIQMRLGWHSYKNSDQLWHVGGVGTFRSSMIINKKRGFAVIVMGNAQGKRADNVHYIAKMLYSDFKNKRIKFSRVKNEDNNEI